MGSGSKKFRETDSWNGDISAKRAPHGRGRCVQILEKEVNWTMCAFAMAVRALPLSFRALNSRGNLVSLKTPKNAQIFVRGPARPHARPHAPAAQNLKNGRYLGYTAPHSRPATGKPTRPIADPKQLSRNRPISGGSTTHNYRIPAPIIGHTPTTRSGIPLSHDCF